MSHAIISYMSRAGKVNTAQVANAREYVEHGQHAHDGAAHAKGHAVDHLLGVDEELVDQIEERGVACVHKLELEIRKKRECTE